LNGSMNRPIRRLGRLLQGALLPVGASKPGRTKKRSGSWGKKLLEEFERVSRKKRERGV